MIKFGPLLALASLMAAASPSEAAPPTEPWAPSGSLALGAALSFADDSSLLGGVSSMAGMDIRLRSLAGETAAYCVGFDGVLGGSSGGLVYETNAYLLGAGLRFGESSYLAACGGAGLSGASGALPFAWQFPAELSAEVQAGPLRVALWSKLLWTTGADARSEGSSSVSFADELSVGASIRLGRPTRYWKNRTTSHGYFLGAQYKELMGTRLIGVMAGVGFWGGR